MATNLLDSVKGLLTPDIMQKISTLIGENPASTQKTVDSAVPSLLAGLTNYVSANPDGASRLLSFLNQGNYGSLLNNLPGLLGDSSATQNLTNSGKTILSMLFGGKLGSLTDLIANSGGIKTSSTSSLLSLIAPLVLGVLARQGLNASSLISLLTGQKDTIAKLAPAGLVSVLGLRNLADLGSNLSGAAAETYRATTRAVNEPIPERSSIGRWLIPLLLLGLLVPWLAFRSCGETAQQPVVKQQPAPTPPAVKPAPTAAPVAKPMAKSVTLPGGINLSLADGSFNYRLAQYLADTADTTVPKTFVFDNLNFEFGTTKLTPESQQTVTDLIVILKAFPSTETRLEGHTDSVGDAEANKKLSQDRADAVKSIMVTNGIDASRLSTTGYGQEKPVAANDTEDGRAQNRRTELVVVKK